MPTLQIPNDGGWPSLSPHLTPEGALPLSLLFWRDRAGIFFPTQTEPWGDLHAASSRPFAKYLREKDGAPLPLVVSAKGWANLPRWESLMRRMLIVALMAGMLNFVPAAYPQETQSRPDGRRLHRVSLIRIIANPSEYDGEPIRVAGYLAGDGLDGAPGLFVSESDGRNGILSNAVDLATSDRAIRSMFGKYVIVSGLYHAPPPHGDFNGYIDNILEVKPVNAGNTSK
jgi:hypothetical protein